MLTDRLEQAAARCEAIKVEIAPLFGQRDHHVRARRIALRREFRQASRELKDVCNDLIIGLEVGFPGQPKRERS